MRMLDLFCGRWGWSKAFAKRGWTCIGVDLVQPTEIPNGCEFFKCDVLDMSAGDGEIFSPAWCYVEPDFICASPPCEQFSVHGLKMWHKNAPYPELGVSLFNHAIDLCEDSGIPHVIENVRAAQQFVGDAVRHAGSFYLWGDAVPPLLPKGLAKGFTHAGGRYRAHENRSITPAEAATIPPELANCVAEYAERLLEREAVAR